MNDAPKVSVVMPVHNRGAMVGAAIESLLRQTLAAIEVVVVDDGSTDDTVARLRAIPDARMVVVEQGHNTGIPAARNAGLAAARGDYVAILDSDDLALPERLARQAAFLDANPGIALVATLSEEIRADGRATGKVKRRPLDADAIRAHALFRCPVLQSTVMARRTVLERYPYDPAFPVCSDYEMFARLTWEHAAATLPQVLVKRRVHEGSISRAKFALTSERNKAVIRARLDAIGMAYTDADVDNHYAIGHLNKSGVAAEAALLPWARRWFPALRAKAVEAGIGAAAIDEMLGALWVKACARSGRWAALAAPELRGAVLAVVRAEARWRLRQTRK